MGQRMTRELTGRALWRASQYKRPPLGLIHRPYCSHDDRAVLRNFGLKASPCRVQGNGDDNAPRESFWGSLKNALVHHRRFAMLAEAQAAVQEYIEIFYHRQRRHSRLGNLSPRSVCTKIQQASSGCLRRECPSLTIHLIEDRQDLLGHRLGRITTHYSAPELANLIEAANRICEQGTRRPEFVVSRRLNVS